MSAPKVKPGGWGREMTPESCPRFEGCSANVCPMDADWRLRWHLKGERACGLLLESVKSGGEARLRGYLPAQLVAVVLAQRGPISVRWGDIRRRLEQAKKSGSRIESISRRRART